MKSPIEAFMKLGEKATGGDPKRHAQFNYYLLWLMILAFFSILISNFMSFLDLVMINFFESLKFLGWSGVMCAILWFQYWGLKGSYDALKVFDTPNIKLEPEQQMLDEFNENELKGGETQMKNCEICNKEIPDNRDVCEDCVKKALTDPLYKENEN